MSDARSRDVAKLLVDELTTKIICLTRSCVVLVCPSAIDLSSSHLRSLTRQRAGRRRQVGTRRRRLPSHRQALLVPAHLRCGDIYACLASSFGIGPATVFRCVQEAVNLLAALAPTLQQAVGRGAAKAFVILDGTLPPIDRIAADRPFHSGKHK